MAPVIKEFGNHKDVFDVKVCVTGQHRQMLDQVLHFFNITPDFDLDLMQPNQTLHGLTANVLIQSKLVFDTFKPDYVIVHGDTTTSMGTSLAAFYDRITLCHVEAGLRTFNKFSPYPEEINREFIGRLADIHFAPTHAALQNLLNERVAHDNVVVTGNTVIDALNYGLEILRDYSDDEIGALKKIVSNDRRLVLVTGHRRENFGDGFIHICEALKEIAECNPQLDIVYPVHLNPQVQGPVYSMLEDVPNIKLIAPLGYPAFLWLMARSFLILTDSGGIQEEGITLRKPILVMRDTTERPEGVASGAVKLVGTNKNVIVNEVKSMFSDVDYYNKFLVSENPYGDGFASKKIVSHLRDA